MAIATGSSALNDRALCTSIVLTMVRRAYVQVAALASEARLPAIYGFRDHVDAGGLVSYGVNLTENFNRCAIYVSKILKGAQPGDLPVEFPIKLELVVNNTAAKALGLVIPLSVLVRADEVIG